MAFLRGKGTMSLLPRSLWRLPISCGMQQLPFCYCFSYRSQPVQVQRSQFRSLFLETGDIGYKRLSGRKDLLPTTRGERISQPHALPVGRSRLQRGPKLQHFMVVWTAGAFPLSPVLLIQYCVPIPLLSPSPLHQKDCFSRPLWKKTSFPLGAPPCPPLQFYPFSF